MSEQSMMQGLVQGIHLSSKQHQSLYRALHHENDLESREAMMICPPCASTNVVKNGHRNGKSSYLCRDPCCQFRDHPQQGYS